MQVLQGNDITSNLRNYCNTLTITYIVSFAETPLHGYGVRRRWRLCNFAEEYWTTASWSCKNVFCWDCPCPWVFTQLRNCAPRLETRQVSCASFLRCVIFFLAETVCIHGILLNRCSLIFQLCFKIDRYVSLSELFSLQNYSHKFLVLHVSSFLLNFLSYLVSYWLPIFCIFCRYHI